VSGATAVPAPDDQAQAAASVPGIEGLPPWALRRAAWFLVALHLPFVAAPPTFTLTRLDSRPWPVVVVVTLLALAIGAIQLHHSLAAARGERPRAWPVTALALALLVYVPIWWFTWDWAVAQWFVVASAPMVLRGRAAVVPVVGPILGTAVVAADAALTEPGGGIGEFAVWTAYNAILLVMGGAALYGSARLVRVVDELQAARAEMARLAVGRERLRVSRDLHDLLGQSLSAVSLKGDLAMRLLPTDAAAARAEIEGLTGLARGALRDVRAVARAEHAVSLRSEVAAAGALLGAAGIAAEVDVDVPDLPPAVEEVLAWAVREGTTNMLRHSDAESCSITAARSGGTVRLEIVNDGLRVAGAEAGATAGAGAEARGSGLAGLVDRARALEGASSAGRTPDGRFRLLVALPDPSDRPDRPEVLA
jgi:two-component system sensor histidine kinase DesK